MSWNTQTQTVLYRSSRSWNTKRNFELFSGADFIAALSEHIPPKSFQTIRYYGLYSNKSRGMRKEMGTIDKFSTSQKTQRLARISHKISGLDYKRAQKILNPNTLYDPLDFSVSATY